MQSSNCLTIDQDAIEHNIATLKKKLPQGGYLMAMVKGNGYGIGMTQLASIVETLGSDILGVSHLDEAIELRKQNIKGPIFALSAPLFEIEKAIIYDIEVALSNAKQALTLNQLAKEANKKAKVHLHIDTGMHRFGCSKEEARQLAHLLSNLEFLELKGIMTHFIGSAFPDYDPITQRQLESFSSTFHTLQLSVPYVHIACSAGVRRFNLPSYINMIRIGLALFGLHSHEDENNNCPLKPALTLTSRLHNIQECKLGAGIGYFHTVTMQKEEGKIGVIPFGYHDGMPITLSKEAYVLVRGQKAPIVGKICMDFTLIDLTDVKEAAVGDEVTIFSPVLRPEQIAKWATINVRTMLCHLGARIERKFITHAKEQRELSTIN